MKFFKSVALFIVIMLVGAMAAYSNTATIGSMWKQIGSVLYVADDVTAVDISGVPITLSDIDADSITVNGVITFTTMTTIFGDYSAINNMNQILCDATAGDVDIHVVSASGVRGRMGNVAKIDVSGNGCDLEPAGAETIIGASNLSITTQYENITYFSDGTNLLIQ